MKESENKKKRKQFEKMIKDENIIKVEKINSKFFIYYKDGSVFKCSGYLPENYGLTPFLKTNIIKKLF